MNALNFHAFDHGTALPVLLLVDPQRTAEMETSPSASDRIEAVEMCRVMLQFARHHGFPIAMTRWRPAGARFRGWLGGLEPRASEMVFDQPRASCYSSEPFAEMMSTGGGGLNAVLACPISAGAWITTAAEARRRGHRITFLSDASASGVLDSTSDDGAEVATRIRQQCELTTVRAWMSSQLAAFRGELGG